MDKVYLDFAASTPVDRRVLLAMEPYFSEKFGNPGSLHSFGQTAIAAVDSSREAIAKAIGAEFREVIFTASATEANNLALRGVLNGIKNQESRIKNSGDLKSRIIISAIEHESVLETARELEREGVEVVYLSVDKQGIVDLRKLRDALNEQTVLVSVMHANNEIGTIQPISEIAKIICDFRNSKSQALNSKHQAPRYPLFHTDSAQAFQFLDCNVQEMGVDMMTLSSHKLYGPKGAGALWMRKGKSEKEKGGGASFISHFPFPISHLLSGGGQEFGFRSGTENVPAIVGFAAAVELRSHGLIRANKTMDNLRNDLWRGIKKLYPKARLNGSLLKDQLPNILNVYFPNYTAQDLLTMFDLGGLAASSGSACRSRAMESSHVIEALGYSKERAKSSIRFSLGRPTTKQELGRALKVVRVALKIKKA